MRDFSVIHRNPGHWDIICNEGRLFRIRGNIGEIWVSDERNQDHRRDDPQNFKTVAAAMAYITDQLMFEPLAEDNDFLVDSTGRKLMAIKI